MGAKLDELVRSPKTPFSVIPAEAGIQEYQEVLDPGACPGPDPGFAGVTASMTFCEAVKLDRTPKVRYLVFIMCAIDLYEKRILT
jgi:hypothetical protein